MKCNICPLYHSKRTEEGKEESCGLFGDRWDSEFQYENNGAMGCYIDKHYIKKVAEEKVHARMRYAEWQPHSW